MSFGDTLIGKKKLITITLVILIVVAVIGFTLSTSSFNSDDNNLTSIIEVDKTIARIEETINFSSENCKGEISSYNWNFGDGNTSTEKNPSHKYDQSDWYNVTLEVIGNNKKISNNTIQIGIQQTDLFYEYSWDRHRELRPRWASGNGLTIPIGPNIGHPQVEIKCTIIQPIGTLEFHVRAEWEIPNSRSWDNLYSESIIGTGQDIEINYIVQPDDYPSEMNEDVLSWIGADVMVVEGRWGNLEMSMNIIYPIDGSMIY